ncbi:MFS transporter [Aestuariimicrobium ganziense]|uniref:MFS transporter n=1 Tax=Aestuariimicrobium ganziense TaxID=2773677 RepID=UPI002E2ABD45|nr:MFS transporter [Aestuariimicrobium ganziense]
MVIAGVKQRLRARSDLPRDVWVLAACAFCVSVGFGVMVPVLPVFARSFDATTFMVGLVISSFSLVRLVTTPVLPWVNRRVGERLVFGAGMFIVAGSTAAMALSQTYLQMLLLRAVGGVGSAMFTVSALVILLRSAPDHQRGRAGALYMGGFLLGGMTGPAIGGLLAAISLTAPFYFYAVMLGVAGAVGLAMLPRHDRTVVATQKRSTASMSQALRDGRYRAALLANFAAGWQSFGVRSALVPLIVVEHLLLESTWTGIAFAIAAVAQTVAIGPVGRAVDTVGRRPIMMLSGAICAVAALAMPFAPNFWVLTAALCVYGVGASMQGTAPTAAVGDVVGGHGGQPVAVFTMVSDLGAIAGPLVAGLLVDASGMPLAFSVGVVLLLASAIAAWRMSPVFGAPRTPVTTEQEDAGAPSTV